jgi:putative tryptophan/tyrosine transport system substrate-binding protein
MQFDRLKRREFISLIGGAAATWPLTARAQQAPVPVVGYLHSGSPDPFAHLSAAFRRGLGETGYVEGRNVAIAYRWAEGKYDRLPALAADLVRSQVTVIAACATSAPGLAAKAATSTIPIVFQTGSDPVQDGLVASMNRPGRNVTGVSRLAVTIEPKRLELLHELSPKATVIGLLVNPTNPRSELVVQQIEEAARALGLRLHVLKASTEGELDGAFASLVQLAVGALLVAQEPSYLRWRDHILALAARHAIPAAYGDREYPAAGGLMSYDASLADSFRQVGVYVGRVLKGEKPADLPVMQPTKFELVLNLKTAKALGLTVPDKLLALADGVIE